MGDVYAFQTIDVRDRAYVEGDLRPALESVWSGDGAPDDPVRVKVTLRPTP